MTARAGALKAAATLAAGLAMGAGAHANPIGEMLDGLVNSERPVQRRAQKPPRPVDVEYTGSIEREPPPAPTEAAPSAAAPAPTARPRAAAPQQAYPVDLLISLANDAVYTADPYPKGQQSDPRMIKLQVLLDRNHVSPGVIDGIFGDNVVKAVKAFEEMRGHTVDGLIDAELWAALEATSSEPVLASYTLTEADVAGPFVPEMPHDYAEQAALPGLSYRDAAEMLAERFHMDEAFLRRINPGVSFAEAGVDVVVAKVGKSLKAKVAHVIADKGRKQIRGYDAAGKLVVAYPATIGSSALPSPTGMHRVKAIALDPDYWYRPQVNFVQGENRKALRLPPGPNGPVGATWIGLDKPTYGMHGTPEPSKIDKTNSHGCVRLTNWDARELSGLVSVGVPVDFQEPPGAETPMVEAEPVSPEGPSETRAQPAPPQALEPLPPARIIPPLRERQSAMR